MEIPSSRRNLHSPNQSPRSRALQNLVPDVPHKHISVTSHWPHLDKPEEFNEMLNQFLATIP